MIFGIGTDILAISRMKKAMTNAAFYTRVFTEGERRLIEAAPFPEERAAGFFCAKEAAAKALRTGFAGLRPSEAEVCCEESGAPLIRLPDRLAAAGYKMSLSISHTAEYAVAFALCEKEEDVK